MTKVTIRPPTDPELPFVLDSYIKGIVLPRLASELGPVERRYWTAPDAVYAAIIQYWHDDLQRHRLCVADADGLLLGWAAATADSTLVGVYVKKSYRRCGMGTRMVAYLGATAVPRQLMGTRWDATWGAFVRAACLDVR
jgi:hypothetical protein